MKKLKLLHDRRGKPSTTRVASLVCILTACASILLPEAAMARRPTWGRSRRSWGPASEERSGSRTSSSTTLTRPETIHHDAPLPPPPSPPPPRKRTSFPDVDVRVRDPDTGEFVTVTVHELRFLESLRLNAPARALSSISARYHNG